MAAAPSSPAHSALLADLRARAETAAHRTGAACPCGATRTLADRPDATVVRHGDTVAKAHAPGTSHADLAARLAVAAALPGVLLPPLATTPLPVGDRLVTFWPHGAPVDPDDPDAAPWEAAATLLARLHRAQPPPGTGPLPVTRGPRKAARAVAALAARSRHPAVPHVLRAWAALPAWARGEAPQPGRATLCHGDLHLGQLVRHPAPGGAWLLIDVDDLGTGVPAWDLARPAAWYACGLLPPGEWARFLAAYRAAGGPAVPADGDPWPALDVPARALTAQTAARALAKAAGENRAPDEVELSVLDACARMAAAPPEPTCAHRA
ncbi:phosphotransferase family protein [Streptomyces doudnae]|uniref:Aminoglycoside phosphotransferase family protein n=2 Tax=Streptomyces TaxID=1883 RepID=A0ABD5ESG5_9ACTN|nr:aminoglycoside phosphotransferase family protein [Streptomyces sp. DSM 41981]MDT0437193.1 aminoglycoside phosphotransferase family protein [Streptomyces sp. DSM 41981]